MKDINFYKSKVDYQTMINDLVINKAWKIQDIPLRQKEDLK